MEEEEEVESVKKDPVGDIEEDVETFNIVITKNLTAGQSVPSIHFLPDAKVTLSDDLILLLPSL